MSIILTTEDGRQLQVNAWNWGVLHYLVERAGLFREEVWIPRRTNGGGSLNAREVGLLAAFLNDFILPRLRAGERMFHTGEITAEPDDGTSYREESEKWRNYSLHRDVLEAVIQFLRQTKGRSHSSERNLRTVGP